MKETDMTESRGLAKAVRALCSKVPEDLPIDLTVSSKYIYDLVAQNKILELEERGWENKSNRDVLLPMYVALDQRPAPIFWTCMDPMQSDGNSFMKYAKKIASEKVAEMSD